MPSERLNRSYRSDYKESAVRTRERHSEMFALMNEEQMHSPIPVTFDGKLPSIAFFATALEKMTAVSAGIECRDIFR